MQFTFWTDKRRGKLHFNGLATLCQIFCSSSDSFNLTPLFSANVLFSSAVITQSSPENNQMIWICLLQSVFSSTMKLLAGYRWKSVYFAHSIYWVSVIFQEIQELPLLNIYLNVCQAEQRKPYQSFHFEEQLQKLWPTGRGFLTWTRGWKENGNTEKTRLMPASISHWSAWK